MDPFLGQITIFGGNFAPRGWAFCEGQLLPINSNQALFSLLGTTYGGDGRTSFGLPDLRGRVAIAPGNGPGLSPRALGQTGGAETTILTANNLPSHSHAMRAKEEGTTDDPAGAHIAGDGTNRFGTSSDLVMGSTANSTSANLPINNVKPTLAMSYIIALQGTFPSRN